MKLARLTASSAWAAILGIYNSDDLTYAASVAYYGLLSLFPILLLAFTVLGRLSANDHTRATVIKFVLDYFPTQFGFIVDQLDAFRSQTFTFGIVGSLAILWGALGVFSAITTAVNYAWHVETSRGFWKHKLFSFLMLVVAGAVLVVALVLVSASRMVEASWFTRVLSDFPGLTFLGSVAFSQATTLLFIVVVGLIYYYVPNTAVRFRDVWIGAIVTGVLWRATFAVFGWYVGDMSRFAQLDGPIAAVVVFLIWVYVQAVILLYGVEFTAAFARLRRGESPVTSR